MYDIIIIGGRVAGARTAELLAEKGAKVLLIDGRKDINVPVQCTGFVSHRFLEILPDFPKKYIHNKISKAKFYAPDSQTFTLTAKSFAVINRGKLDSWLLNRAKKAGVKVMKGVIFKNKKLYPNYIELTTSRGRFKSRILIGADGPGSAVANSCGIKAKPQFYGIQATVKGKFDDSNAKLYFGSRIAPRYFAWIVPINKSLARIGLATKSNPYNYFKKFTNKKLGYIPKPNVSGAIKCHYQNKIVSDRIMLVGDAASQVKPFSGGGIVYSLTAADLCARAGISAIKSNTFDEQFLKRHYQKQAHKKFKAPIKRGLLIYYLWQYSPDIIKNLVFSIMNITHAHKLAEHLDVDFY